MQARPVSERLRSTAGEKPGRPGELGLRAGPGSRRGPVSINASVVSQGGVDALDAADLSEFGYTQQLRRGLGSYASFAAGFSFVSILTTVFQLFSFGYGFGGPAFFWTWPLVFAGQFTVALYFA